MFATIKNLIPEPRQAHQPRRYTGRHRRADPVIAAAPVSPASAALNEAALNEAALNEADVNEAALNEAALNDAALNEASTSDEKAETAAA